MYSSVLLLFFRNVTDWCVEDIKNMERVFEHRNVGECNPDVSNWNVSKVTSFVSKTLLQRLDVSFDEVFCHGYNHIIFTHLNDLSYMLQLQKWMFYNQTTFNQDIGSWDVSNGQDFVSEINNEQNKIDHTTFMTVC